MGRSDCFNVEGYVWLDGRGLKACVSGLRGWCVIYSLGMGMLKIVDGLRGLYYIHTYIHTPWPHKREPPQHVTVPSSPSLPHKQISPSQRTNVTSLPHVWSLPKVFTCSLHPLPSCQTFLMLISEVRHIPFSPFGRLFSTLIPRSSWPYSILPFYKTCLIFNSVRCWPLLLTTHYFQEFLQISPADLRVPQEEHSLIFSRRPSVYQVQSFNWSLDMTCFVHFFFSEIFQV